MESATVAGAGGSAASERPEDKESCGVWPARSDWSLLTFDLRAAILAMRAAAADAVVSGAGIEDEVAVMCS